jgi:hypothetical protein
VHTTAHSNTPSLQTSDLRVKGTFWSLTGVYGPQSDADKIAFLMEIRDLRPLMHPEWLLLGDLVKVKED